MQSYAGRLVMAGSGVAPRARQGHGRDDKQEARSGPCVSACVPTRMHIICDLNGQTNGTSISGHGLRRGGYMSMSPKVVDKLKR